MVTDPLVTVVIPSWNRTFLAQRAVASALTQTEQRIEVVVVVDESDGDTAAALSRIEDRRLRTIELESRHGAAAARNRGIADARAPWIALLDDDDEWFPQKLATQLEMAETSRWRRPIIASRLVARTPGADLLLPRRLPGDDEPLSEYLTVRHHAFRGEGFLSTSTLMAPTALFREVPFKPGLPRVQDWDWLLRAVQIPEVGVEYGSAALSVRHDDEDRPRISTDPGWQAIFDWVTANRSLFTPRAYAAALMGLVSSLAAPSHSPRICGRLLRESLRGGRPGALELVTFAQIWLFPRWVRHAVRDPFIRRSLSYRGLRRRPSDGTRS